MEVQGDTYVCVSGERRGPPDLEEGATQTLLGDRG